MNTADRDNVGEFNFSFDSIFLRNLPPTRFSENWYSLDREVTIVFENKFRLIIGKGAEGGRFSSFVRSKLYTNRNHYYLILSWKI